MTYPPPNADQYCVKGYEFFRLNTLLSSPGDIYESAQGAAAIALGPESDVSNVNVGYFDDQVRSFVNQTVIGPGRAWSGLIGARNNDTYAPSKRPGRIMMWPSDIYDPSFRPANFGPSADSLTFVQPRLDVIQYFSNPGSLQATRNDKTFRFQELPLPSGTGYLVIPYWGRKYASIRVTNLTSQNILWEVQGLIYYINDTFAGLQTSLDSDLVATTTQHETIVRASVDGMFDALMVSINDATTDGPTPIQITVSDTP